MSAIQTGSNVWVDGYARFSGAYGRNGPSFADFGIDADSLSSVISDIEEEGEIEITHEHSDSDLSVMEQLTDEIEAGNDDLGASEEIVAAIAAHIGIIEAAMRRHQLTGIFKFHDRQTDQETSAEDFKDANQDDLKLNAELALAATVPGNDRMGILSLLA
jgi:hypothetical protein